jgi:outer membrane protein TolC
MKKQLIFILLTFWLGLQGLELSLQDAIQMALSNNKELQQAQEEVHKYRNDYNNVKGNLFPQLTFNSGYQYSHTRLPDSSIPPMFSLADIVEDDSLSTDTDATIAGFFDQAIGSFIPEKTQKENSVSLGLELTQVVFMGGKLINGISIAGKLYTLQERKYFLVEQDVKFQTIELFYNCLLAKDVMEIQEDALELATRYFLQVSDMFEEGLVSEYDYLRAQLEADKLKPQAQEAKKNFQLAMQMFQNHLGTVETLDLIGEINLPEFQFPNLDSSIEEGLQNRVELELSALNVEVNRINLRYEKGNFLPNIGISAKMNKFAQSESGIQRDDWGDLYQIGIGFSMPLFTGFSNTAKMRKARHSYRQAQLSDKDLEEKIELDIRNSYLTLQNELEKLSIQEQNKALAERGLTIAEARYQNQVSNQLEIFDAQLQLKTAKLSERKAIFDSIVAYEAFKKSIGKKL